MAKNAVTPIFGFTFKKNTELNRLTTKVLWHFHFQAEEVIEISKKTNVRSWSENIKTQTCLMFLDNFTRAMILNSYPNGFCSLRSVLALQGTLVILIQYDKNIWVSLSSFKIPPTPWGRFCLLTRWGVFIVLILKKLTTVFLFWKIKKRLTQIGSKLGGGTKKGGEYEKQSQRYSFLTSAIILEKLRYPSTLHYSLPPRFKKN